MFLLCETRFLLTLIPDECRAITTLPILSCATESLLIVTDCFGASISMRVVAETAPRQPAMQLPGVDFEVINIPRDFQQPENATEYFSLTAFAETRISRATSSQDEITAPMVLKRLCYPFVVCEATVTTDFQLDWDQGGLVIFAGRHPVQHICRNAPPRQVTRNHTWRTVSSKWARVALELVAGEITISTLVANPDCDVDWASTPIFPHSRPVDTLNPSVRLKLERVNQDLWIWYKVEDTHYSTSSASTPESVSRQWRKCRQVVNFFDAISVKGGVWVGCYASRPIEADTAYGEPEENGLFVEFEDLTIL